VLVLPDIKTMTPELLIKIEILVKAGATIIGNPPNQSPGLINYPKCDQEVKTKAEELWGGLKTPEEMINRRYGSGQIFWGGSVSKNESSGLYPDYESTAEVLRQLSINEDLKSNGTVRYTHRKTKNFEIYFVSNKEDKPIETECRFRVANGNPELWDPLSGEIRGLPIFKHEKNTTTIPLKFEAHQSYFILFNKNADISDLDRFGKKNFPEKKVLMEIKGPWRVYFNSQWGGPDSTIFNELVDWTKNSNEGIRYYSGTAAYRNIFKMNPNAFDRKSSRFFIDLGEVKHMARVHINGQDLGVIWTDPWQKEITGYVHNGNNKIEIEVVNLWPNRLIGDAKLMDDGIKDGHWPDWLLRGQMRPSERFTFTTYPYYSAESPLIKSGLLGPIQILILDN
jgi:hypothetical protein